MSDTPRPKARASEAIHTAASHPVRHHAQSSIGQNKNDPEQSQSESESESETSGESESDDPDKFYIHFREIPKDAIQRDHVAAILGPDVAKTNESIELKTEEIQRLKTEIRGWASEHIKRRMLCTAKQLNLKLDGKYTLNSFVDINAWWRSCHRSDFKALDQLNFILYGWFTNNPSWSRQLERQFMKEHNLGYTKESKAIARKSSKRQGLQLKGCVAQTIAYIKVEVVKQVQRVGKASKHGMAITKSRPADLIRDADGKYVKRKDDEYC